MQSKMVADSEKSYLSDIDKEAKFIFLELLKDAKHYKEKEISKALNNTIDQTKKLFDACKILSHSHRNNAALEKTNNYRINIEKYRFQYDLIKILIMNAVTINTEAKTESVSFDLNHILDISGYSQHNKQELKDRLDDKHKDAYLSTPFKLTSDTKLKLVGTATFTYNLKNMHNNASLSEAVSAFFVEPNMQVDQLIEFATERKYLVNISSRALSVVTWPSGHQMLDPKVRILQQTNEFNDFQERVHSFLLGTNALHNIWPDEAVLRPGPLISAGFMYEGNNTEVVCRICGLKSNTADWKRDDEDYAMYVHQQTSSPCIFLERYSYPVNLNYISNRINANDLRMNQYNFICYSAVNHDNSMLKKSMRHKIPITHIINKLTNQIWELCLKRLICVKNAYKDILYSCKNIALCWECSFVTELCAYCETCFSIGDWKCYTFKFRLQNIFTLYNTI